MHKPSKAVAGSFFFCRFLLFFNLYFSDSTEFSVCFVSFYGLVSSYFIIVSFAFLYFAVCECCGSCFFNRSDLFVLAVFLCGTVDFVSGCFAVLLPLQECFFLFGRYGQFCYFCRSDNSLCARILISVCAVVCISIVVSVVIAVIALVVVLFIIVFLCIL